MRNIFIIFFYLVPLVFTYSQKSKECDCIDARLAFASSDSSTSGLFSRNEAITNIKRLLGAFNRNSETKFTETIYANHASCAVASRAIAAICEEKDKTNLRGRYILYDSTYMNLLKDDDSELFILAHEIGHHLCNHLHSKDFRNPQQIKSVSTKDIQPAYYHDPISKSHVKELDADAMAVWLLKKLGNTDDFIKKGFENIILFEIKSKIDPSQPTEKHPSLSVRKASIHRFLNKWKTQFESGSLYPVYEIMKFSDDNYKEILLSIEEQARVYLTELEKQQIIRIKNADRARALKKQAEELNKQEKYINSLDICKESRENWNNSGSWLDSSQLANVEENIIRLENLLKIKNYYTIEPVLSIQYPYFELNSNGKKYPTQSEPGISTGARFTFNSWEKKIRYELEARYTWSNFYTLAKSSAEDLGVESFRLNSISVQPRLIFSTIGQREPVESHKNGLIITVGPSSNFYFSNKYRFLIQDSEKEYLKIKPAIGGMFGIGFEKKRRNVRHLFGNIRLMLTTSYSPLIFDNTVRTKVDYSAKCFIYGFEFSIRRW